VKTHIPALQKRASVAVLLAGALFVAVAGCSEEEEEAAPTVAPKAAEAAATPDKAEAEKKAPDQAYSYEVLVNGQMRRDPFKTYFDELNAVDGGAGSDKLTELQKIDLDKLKLVAVIVGTATPMAMVEEPGGKGHTLKIGTLVGRRLGQVKHIRRGEVVVQEEFRDFTGKRVPQLKELKLDTETSPTP
jgi:type IV pilus assembly protein PilP